MALLFSHNPYRRGVVCKQIICNYHAWKILYQKVVMAARRTVRLGGPAFNADVVGLDGVTRHLLDFQQDSRPLVLVFGSCT